MEHITKEHKLAMEIAEILDDVHSLNLHLSFVRNYSESFLRQKLADVMAVPKEKIKTTRARYYTHLVTQHYDSRKRNHPRD